jgi:fructose-1,6-bisphosphatase/inositol monophosphatase family enzyme
MRIQQYIEPIRRLHDEIRGRIVEACEDHTAAELAQAERTGAGDVSYSIDEISESALVEWFTREIDLFGSMVLIGEGLPNGRLTLPAGAGDGEAAWRVIVDPIDGTRGLMYQKRPGWLLTAVAPNRGEQTSLADIELAIQTELPLVKQQLCDQLWATKGDGAHAIRINRLTNESRPLNLAPSPAIDLRHGYGTVCRFFPGGREMLAAFDDALCERIAPTKSATIPIFEDQQCTAGQLYGLATGQDRFVADLRPLVQPIMAERGITIHCCHSYDICAKLIAEEAGVVITSPDGAALQSPLDTETNVAWVGYANRELQKQMEPVLQELLSRFPPHATTRWH